MARLSMKGKLTASLMAIAAVLLISSIISVMEYRRVSSYVSDLIAQNINNVNVSRRLAEATNRYNLDILTVIGDDSLNSLPDFDADAFMVRCDSLRSSLSVKGLQPLADSVEYSYAAYMLTARELPEVLKSDFIDSRSWYFDRLQPRYNRLQQDIDDLSSAIYKDLSANSLDFDRGFYRSIIPGIVAVGVGLLLILMLLFYLIVYYANPLYKMLRELNAYRSFNKKYSYEFDGDDQLAELNRGITEITDDNQTLRTRIADLRKRVSISGEQK